MPSTPKSLCRHPDNFDPVFAEDIQVGDTVSSIIYFIPRRVKRVDNQDGWIFIKLENGAQFTMTKYSSILRKVRD